MKKFLKELLVPLNALAFMGIAVALLYGAWYVWQHEPGSWGSAWPFLVSSAIFIMGQWALIIVGRGHYSPTWALCFLVYGFYVTFCFAAGRLLTGDSSLMGLVVTIVGLLFTLVTALDKIKHWLQFVGLALVAGFAAVFVGHQWDLLWTVHFFKVMWPFSVPALLMAIHGFVYAIFKKEGFTLNWLVGTVLLVMYAYNLYANLSRWRADTGFYAACVAAFVVVGTARWRKSRTI